MLKLSFPLYITPLEKRKKYLGYYSTLNDKKNKTTTTTTINTFALVVSTPVATSSPGNRPLPIYNLRPASVPNVAVVVKFCCVSNSKC